MVGFLKTNTQNVPLRCCYECRGLYTTVMVCTGKEAVTCQWPAHLMHMHGHKLVMHNYEAKLHLGIYRVKGQDKHCHNYIITNHSEYYQPYCMPGLLGFSFQTTQSVPVSVKVSRQQLQLKIWMVTEHVHHSEQLYQTSDWPTDFNQKGADKKRLPFSYGSLKPLQNWYVLSLMLEVSEKISLTWF